jgi:hypothetical protein
MTVTVTQQDRDALNALDDALGFLMDDERGIVLEALARHREQARADAWRPIETAPKDGTEIVLWPALRRPIDGVVPPTTGAWYTLSGEGLWYDLSVGHHNGFWKPTHWMPLPPAPDAIEQGALRHG